MKIQYKISKNDKMHDHGHKIMGNAIMIWISIDVAGQDSPPNRQILKFILCFDGILTIYLELLKVLQPKPLPLFQMFSQPKTRYDKHCFIHILFPFCQSFLPKDGQGSTKNTKISVFYMYKSLFSFLYILNYKCWQQQRDQKIEKSQIWLTYQKSS